MNISRNKPKIFNFGSLLNEKNTNLITEYPDDHIFNILVFKVNVGQSSIQRVRDAQPGGDGKSELDYDFKENYDSVYLEPAQPDERRRFQMQYVVGSAESVTMTHVIKTKIKLHEPHMSEHNAKCFFCGAKAEKYCENCQKFFCQTHDDLAHGGEEIETHDEKRPELGQIMNKLRTNHKRTSIQEAPYRFGRCSEKPIEHENR